MKRVIAITLSIAVTASAVSCASSKKMSTPSSSQEQSASVVQNGERDGSSFEKAVKVHSIEEEYQWVAEHHPSVQLKKQSLVFNKKKPYDILTFTRKDGSDQNFYFDISSFYGEF